MWLAQADPVTSPVDWVQLGVTGLVVFALMKGWLWPKPPVDRLVEDNERMRRDLEACRQQLVDEVRALRTEIRELRREVAGRDGPGP